MQETYLEVNIDKIRNNILNIRNLNDKSRFCAVVKANAYGLGADEVSKGIEDIVDYLAVARFSEAMQLRRNNIKKPILILGYVAPEDIKECAKNNIDISIYDLDLATKINDLGYKINAHLVIDTGHGRIGFREHEINKIRKLKDLEFINIISAFSHFSTSDEEDVSFTNKQNEIFDRVIEKVKDDFNFKFVHLSNSAGVLKHQIFKTMYRVGISIYGLYPSEIVKNESNIKLEKAFNLYSFVHFIKYVEANTPISYGRTYITDKPMKIATVAIGYADGFSRAFSNKGYIFINGKYCKILGRVCMDQIMVDVTDLDDIKIGDRVELFKDIDVDAQNIGTISYELISNISMRVKRVYIKDESLVANRNYLGELNES